MATLDPSSVHLYAVTLQRGASIQCMCHGAFSGLPKQQEIACAHNDVLELYKVDAATGKLKSILHSGGRVFGVIRSLTAFRLTGSQKDYLVVGSDSGRIVILEFQPAKGSFDRVHMETFGKSGARRCIPGQFVAADAKGRAIMIAAVEKQKLVYIMNRDGNANLTISSPLEGHKAHTLLFHCVGVDVGFENPMFACLELDYEDADDDTTGEAAPATRQSLTFYELDLGLNHVVRKASEPLRDFANLLVAVPGGSDGPSGVIVCCEGYLLYKCYGETTEHRVALPRRRNDISDPTRIPLVVAAAAHKTKSMFFFLVQTDSGDLFRVMLDVDPEENTVTKMRIKYFDTVPVAAGICVLRSGFLFVASEFGNHHLYQITQLGDGGDEPEFNSKANAVVDSEDLDDIPAPLLDATVFIPRPLLNLMLVDELESLAPILDSCVADLAGEDSMQLYSLCGRGPRSSVRTLRHGLAVAEMAVSALPGNPSAIWSVKRARADEFDRYIVVSFVNATLVLSIGETVEEVSDSGLMLQSPTIHVAQIGDDDLLQVYPGGLRHVKADRRVNEWKTPSQRPIACAAVNERQVALALGGGEIVYFELDMSGQLNESTERCDLPAEAVCMAIGSVPVGRQRFSYLAIGCADNTVRIVSLNPTTCLQPVGMQALPAQAASLCIVEMSGDESAVATGGNMGGAGSNVATRGGGGSSLFLNIGLDNGVLLRSSLDGISGQLTDTRTRYLGARPVRMFRVDAQGNQAVLALSSRSWLSYSYEARYHMSPLNYEVLEHASAFHSAQCPEGIVAISGDKLRIIAVPQLGSLFNTVTTPVTRTPRRLAVHPTAHCLYLLESDHRAFSEAAKANAQSQLQTDENEMVVDEEMQLPEEVFGSAKAPAGAWAAQVRVVRAGATGESLLTVPLDENHAGYSIAVVEFASHPDALYLVVGAVPSHNLSKPLDAQGVLYTFEIGADGVSLRLVHRTAVDGVPGALCAFQGRLAVGVGRALRLFDLGQSKLLRKCENKRFPTQIVWIGAMGNRLTVGDLQESFHFVRYRHSDNQLVVFADDSLPRHVTSAVLLDYSTVAAGDKFGNVFVLRLPHDVNDDRDDSATSASRLLYERHPLNSADQKAELLCAYYVGDTVTSLQKARLSPSGEETLVFTTLGGSIGCLMAFRTREDIEFFQHLEMHMRQEQPPLLGRDHLAYRSSYQPCKAVIDGDLCELFGTLDVHKRRSIAEELDRSPAEVNKKLEDMRTRHAF